jgi:hypothetical protein
MRLINSLPTLVYNQKKGFYNILVLVGSTLGFSSSTLFTFEDISMDHHTRKLLGLTDKNLSFSENWLTERKEDRLTLHVIQELVFQVHPNLRAGKTA